MMKRSVIGILCGIALSYAALAFITWDFDPGNWQRTGRLLCCVFALGLAVAGAAIGHAMDEEAV
ncbi:MAG: hypothetical protein EON59_03835 [Alphaproteobacteria bacterium]|nr:MAG: hypothetical protein EON59_03835 [Alphaproteobacteria bacterium]